MPATPDHTDPAPEGFTANAHASDSELVERCRAGDSEAFGELWKRHASAGRAAARAITSSIDSDDLVSEAFARIWQTILRGGGPTNGFRTYLLVTIRNLAARIGSRSKKEVHIDWAEDIPDESTTEAETLRGLDRDNAGKAFATLPPRWQEALWYSEVEGYNPTEIGKLLGISATAAAMLSFRAREGLRRAWVQSHITSTGSDPDHAWAIERLAANTRDTLSRRDRRRFDEHLRGCPGCTKLAGEAEHVNSRLTHALLPLVVGVAGALGYRAAVEDGTTRVALEDDPALMVEQISLLAAGATGTGGAAAASNSVGGGGGGAPSVAAVTGWSVVVGGLGASAAIVVGLALFGQQPLPSTDTPLQESRDAIATPPPEERPSELNLETPAPIQPSTTDDVARSEVQTVHTELGELTVAADRGPRGVFFPRLSGTAPAGLEVVVFGGGAEVGRTRAAPDGSWDIDQIDLHVESLAIELADAPGTRAMVASAPAVPQITSQHSGAHWTLAVTGVPGAHIEIQDDAHVTLAAARLDRNGEWTAAYPAALLTDQVRVRYAAGNRSGPWIELRADVKEQ
ncbi:sigma-70 family RNA polymerase sigma factor [Microbacterium sp. NPDC055665]